MKKLFFLFVVIFSGFAWADKSMLGMLVEVKGIVSVTRESTGKIPAKLGQKLTEGDSVNSEEGSSAKIVMKDGNVFLLHESSELVLKEYQKADSTSGNTTLQLKGDAHFQIKKKYDDENATFRVVAPTAVAGVRGTEFLMEADPEKMRLTTFEGSVAVGEKMNGRSIQDPIKVEKGFQVAAGSGPIKAEKLTQLAPHEIAKIHRYGLRMQSSRGQRPGAGPSLHQRQGGGKNQKHSGSSEDSGNKSKAMKH